MSRVRPPDNLSIASLKQKQQEYFNPMAPGSGTPWEDRGTHGPVSAFIKTCKMSISAPAQLFGLIRRPETTGDTTAFVIGCAVFWGVSAFIHAMIRLVVYERRYPTYDIDMMWYLIYSAIGFAAAAAGSFLLFRLFNIIYGKLVAQEKSQTLLPAPLLYNVTAYAMGPSLLAIVPFLGPPLALLLIFVDLVIGGSKRLRLRTAAALIDALLAMIVIIAVGAAAYFAGNFLINTAWGESITPPPPPRTSHA